MERIRCFIDSARADILPCEREELAYWKMNDRDRNPVHLGVAQMPNVMPRIVCISETLKAVYLSVLDLIFEMRSSALLRIKFEAKITQY